jgi:signal transduction histidine kinase
MKEPDAEIMNIEEFFLNTLLRISILGVFLVLVSNLLLFPEDTLSISISLTILLACFATYIMRQRFPTMAVVSLCSVVLITMTYQRLVAPTTTTTISVVLVVGFIVSVLLKGRLMWVMHLIAFILLNTVFILQITGAIVAAITYSTLYFILTYATWVLKSNYDQMNQRLRNTNIELQEKTQQIAVQNQELLLIHANLNLVNVDLEKIVTERTAKIQLQNQTLIKYSNANAHQLRGPVARLLGLASVYKLDPMANPDLIINKMIDQANEIDFVVKQINVDLEGAVD